MSFRNCRRVQLSLGVFEGPREEMKLEEGWVGVAGTVLHFRPTRGSGGYALYSTEKQAKKQTGCTEAMKVSLRLVP